MNGLRDTQDFQALLVEFEPELNYSSRQKDMIADWLIMRMQIDEWRRGGFATTKVVIKGASFIGEGDGYRPLLTQARVFYTDPDSKDLSYHVNFIDHDVMTLVVFRATDAEVTGKSSPVFRDHYALTMCEHRLTMGANVLGFPVGLAETGKTLPRQQALNEVNEETGLFRFYTLAQDLLKPLGDSFGKDSSLSAKLIPYVAEVDMPRDKLEELIKDINGTETGNAYEDERTRPFILPLDEAHTRLTIGGHQSESLTVLTRYMLGKGFLAYNYG
jgi:hypothetical protein